jgi:hypothetical protein
MAGTSFEHAAEARAALHAIVSDPDLGMAALSSEKVMANLLKDFLPDAPRETAILVAAAGNGVASALRERMAQGMDAGTAVSLAASSFAGVTPFLPEACAWAASEIALALGLSTPADPIAPAAWPQHVAPPPAPATPDPRYAAPPAPDPRYAAPPAPDPRYAAPPAPDPRYAAPAAPGTFDVTRAPSNWPSAAPAPQPSTTPRQGQSSSGSSRRSAKVWGAVAAAVVAAAVVVAVVLLIPSSKPKPKPIAAKPSVHVYQATSGPIGVALMGSHAWISQSGPDKIVELNTSDGSQVTSITQGLDFPWGIAAGGGYVWIANDRKNPGSVTKLNAATGAVTQLAGPSQGIANPTAVAVQGSHVWVANLGTQTRTGFTGYGSVIELDASTDAVLKTIPGTKAGITYPVSIAASGAFVWIVDAGYKGGLGGVTRIDTRDGSSFTKTGGGYGFVRPAAIAVSGSHVWVLNDPYRGSLSVTEMNASDGSWVQTLSGPQYGFGSYVSLFGYRPEGIAAAGNRVWVADPNGGTDGHGAVTEINARTGALVRVLSGSPYNLSTPNAVAAAGSQVWIASFGPKNTPGSITVLKSFR